MIITCWNICSDLFYSFYFGKLEYTEVLPSGVIGLGLGVCVALLLSSTWLSPHPSSQGSTTLLRERVVVQYLSSPTLVSKGLESLPLCCDRKKPPFASLLPPRFGALRGSQIQQSLKPDWGMMLQSPVWWVHLQCPPPSQTAVTWLVFLWECLGASVS